MGHRWPRIHPKRIGRFQMSMESINNSKRSEWRGKGSFISEVVGASLVLYEHVLFAIGWQAKCRQERRKQEVNITSIAISIIYTHIEIICKLNILANLWSPE